MTEQLDLLAKDISGLKSIEIELVREVTASPRFQGIHDAKFHEYRYALSLQFLRENFRNEAIRVLEVGEPGPFTEMILKVFPRWSIVHQEEDLRDGLFFDSNTFDLVISTEVLEHIADTNIGHEITCQGVKDHLRDISRVLKHKGRLFLTTPNASSIWCIKRILMQEPPLVYERHYREFSHKELAELVCESGLNVLSHESKIVWNFWDFSDIESFMKSRNYDLTNRGDDQFMLAEKVNKI
jgi:SAM-dependent methyltransferase